MFGLTGSELLGLTVLGAIVTTIGNLVAVWLRDGWLNRSFERWKDRRALEAVQRRFRDPLSLACEELRSRLQEVNSQYPTVYLTSEVLNSGPRELLANNTSDAYFRKYKLVSTAYRLCAFFGWLELYRREVTFLQASGSRQTGQLNSALRDVRAAMADGGLNKAQDWHRWTDRLIFREDQRAIGEAMLSGDSNPIVIGYGRFRDLFDEAQAEPGVWWLQAVLAFLIDLEDSTDFRRQRLELVHDHLGVCLEALGRRPR